MFDVRRVFAMAMMATVAFNGVAQAQECADLPKLNPPTLEKCKGGFFESLQEVVGAGCKGRNDRKTLGYERASRGFATGLEYDSDKLFFTSLDDSARVVTVDSLRGCRGEDINLELTPGNVSYFEYQLTSPSNVVVARGAYRNWSGDRILGDNLTLPESGYYILTTRTTASPKTQTRKGKNGSVEYYTTYPRHFRVGFRSDASVAELTAGAKVDATVTDAQPFIRRVLVKGGAKVRFRFASMGTGDLLVKVMRETGEELYRNPTPTSYYESAAFTLKTDETFRVEVRPWTLKQSVGLQFSVVDDATTEQPVMATSRIVSAFKLPAHFDAATDETRATSETSRLIFNADQPQALTMTVRPSQIAGLTIRVRVYNAESEELAVKPTTVVAPTSITVPISEAGKWIVELMPTSAADMQEAGEAKYTVDFAPVAPTAAPPAASVPAKPAAKGKKPPR